MIFLLLQRSVLIESGDHSHPVIYQTLLLDVVRVSLLTSCSLTRFSQISCILSYSILTLADLRLDLVETWSRSFIFISSQIDLVMLG